MTRACIANQCREGRDPCERPECVDIVDEPWHLPHMNNRPNDAPPSRPILITGSTVSRVRMFVSLYRLWRGAGHRISTALRWAWSGAKD